MLEVISAVNNFNKRIYYMENNFEYYLEMVQDKKDEIAEAIRSNMGNSIDTNKITYSKKGNTITLKVKKLLDEHDEDDDDAYYDVSRLMRDLKKEFSDYKFENDADIK